MGMLGNAVYRVLCSVIACSIILSLFPEGRMKELLRGFSGIFLTVILLSFLPGMKLPDLEGIGGDYFRQAQKAAAAGEDYARHQYREYIKQRLEAYILDTAKTIGCELRVHVEVDGNGCPVSAALWGDISPEERRELETILSEELGIAKEDQQWNGLQTRKRSAHS